MNISMILEMVASGGDRPVVTANGRSLTASNLLLRARAAAHRFRGRPAVLYLSPSHLAYPVALFGAALAGIPFIPSTTASANTSWPASWPATPGPSYCAPPTSTAC